MNCFVCKDQLGEADQVVLALQGLRHAACGAPISDPALMAKSDLTRHLIASLAEQTQSAAELALCKRWLEGRS